MKSSFNDSLMKSFEIYWQAFFNDIRGVSLLGSFAAVLKNDIANPWAFCGKWVFLVYGQIFLVSSGADCAPFGEVFRLVIDLDPPEIDSFCGETDGTDKLRVLDLLEDDFILWLLLDFDDFIIERLGFWGVLCVDDDGKHVFEFVGVTLLKQGLFQVV